MKSMKSNFEKVIEFCLCANHPVNTDHQLNIFNEKPERVLLRFKLIDEEVNELTKAVKEHDLVETIDALADILYVTYGAGVEMGINLDRDLNNRDLDKRVKYNTMISRLAVFSKIEMTTEQIEKIMINVDHSNCSNENMKVVFKDLEKHFLELIELCYDVAHYMKVDLNKAFDLVHASNMTKFCENEQEAKDTIVWYEINEQKYKKPSYRLSNDGFHWICYDEENDKILKSIKYTPVDLKSMLIDPNISIFNVVLSEHKESSIDNDNYLFF